MDKDFDKDSSQNRTLSSSLGILNPFSPGYTKSFKSFSILRWSFINIGGTLLLLHLEDLNLEFKAAAEEVRNRSCRGSLEKMHNDHPKVP